MSADDIDRKFAEALAGREVTIWLPRNLERRLRAALHRMNANVLTAGWAEDEQWNVNDDEDLQSVLVTAAKYGVKNFEEDDGALYDEDTGLVISTISEVDE